MKDKKEVFDYNEERGILQRLKEPKFKLTLEDQCSSEKLATALTKAAEFLRKRNFKQ